MGLQQSMSITRGTHLDLPSGVQFDLIREVPQARIAHDFRPAQCQRFRSGDISHSDHRALFGFDKTEYTRSDK
jgi:hypothetical protein